MNILCPHCRQPMENNAELAGQTVACPLCYYQFVMPGIPIATSVQPVVSHSVSTTSSSHIREAHSLSEMFESSFDVYVTPLIVRAIWLFNLIAAFLLIVAAVIAVFAIPFDPNVARNWEVVRRCCGVLFLLGILFFELLSLRLGLEMAVVFFNVSLSLQSIDKKTKV